MIVFSFALPEESKGFVGRLKRPRRSGSSDLPTITGTIGGREVVVMHTGMGMSSATGRLGSFLRTNSPNVIVASGFGGGLSPALKIGDIVAATNFSDPGLLAAIGGLKAQPGVVITTRKVIETAEEKRDLARHTGAIVVDMESAAISRVCADKAIPLLALRSISDVAEQDMPVRSSIWYDYAKQKPTPGPLMLHLARHPGRIGPFVNFVGGVNKARRSLTSFLVATLSALPEK